MSKFHYTVAITRLGLDESREITCEADGIFYRAEILKASTRAYAVRMVEPMEAYLHCELPLFVVGLTSYRFIQDGKATDQFLGSVRNRMVATYRSHQIKANDPFIQGGS